LAIELALMTTSEGTVVAHLGSPDQPLAPPTPLAGLPRVEGEQNPFAFNPIEPGQRLFAALGGEALLDQLARDDDQLLLLITDDRTSAVPWEYAVTNNGEPLVWLYPLLRLLPAAPAPRPAPAGPLNLAVLAADPLVGPEGEPLPAYRRFGAPPGPDETASRLDIEHELAEIKNTLARSNKSIEARRVPPTQAELQKALRRGPAVLHLSCHGTVIAQQNGQKQAILSLEDNHGRLTPLRGDRLKRLPPPGVLRLVVTSACQTAVGPDSDANLARALVETGTSPAAIGMQGLFPDLSSAAFAANLYDTLLAGFDLGEALRQARQSLPQGYAGLPVAYVTNHGWHALEVTDGYPALAGLRAGQRVSLPQLLTPPDPLIGREQALHQLAETMAQHRVVTIVGTGGIGKSALAAAYAYRFSWRWPGGIIGLSFVELQSVSPVAVMQALLSRMLGDQAAQAVADRPAAIQFERLLAEATQRRPLVIVDNYETIQQILDPTADPEMPDGIPPVEPGLKTAADELHRMLAQLAETGIAMLLTSRRQPVGFRHEVIFPPQQAGALPGLSSEAGAELFIQSSSRAKRGDNSMDKVARQVAVVTAGHPLAISLLAGEFDTAEHMSAADFLANWDSELDQARRDGMAPHQVTFATAFDRSFRALPPRLQQRLATLARFEAPFFAEGAALLWGEPLTEERLTGVRADLATLTRRSLLAVEGWFEDDTPATYWLEPVIQRHLGRKAGPATGLPAPQAAYAGYTAWLAKRCYGDIHRSPALARLARQWLDELLAQADAQPPDNLAWYGRYVGWLLRHYGRQSDAGPLLDRAAAAARKQQDQQALSGILYEQADQAVVRGDLDKALSLYHDSLAIKEQIGDLKGKAASLHQMAQVYLTRGDLDKALSLYHDSLAIKEQIGDLKGKAASLHQMAQVYLTRGDLDKALSLYHDSLAILEQIGDLQGKAASLSNMAQVYLTRGDLDKALSLYHDSLAIKEQIGDLKGKAASLSNMAQVYLTRGDLDKALSLYHDSLAILEQIGDLQGKAASLSNMAQVYLTRGDLDKALSLYHDSLAILEQIGDLQGKAASLSNMAQVYLTRGDLDKALSLYHDSLAILEQIGDLQGKAASLSNMAQVYLTRGDLDKALSLYHDSLAIKEQIGDLKGKAASLSNMAQVYLTRGDLDKALSLYHDSLAILEQIGDLQGKAASLSNMAQVYLTRGDLDKALSLYHDSLAILEQIGDLQGKAASLSNMAQVYLTRGDLDKALSLYHDSLAILEQIGDLKGKAASLSGLANIFMARQEWDAAGNALTEALGLSQRLNAPADTAFNIVKFGQVAQGQGRLNEARARYQEGLTIFERLGMPEADQVRQMLAALDGMAASPSGPQPPADVVIALTRAAYDAARGQHPPREVAQAMQQAAAQPEYAMIAPYLTALAVAVVTPGPETMAALVEPGLALSHALAPPVAANFCFGLARLLEHHRQTAEAVVVQDMAIELLRRDNTSAGRQALSVALYNQAGFLARLERFDDAVTAMEEVVAIDRAENLDDLVSDQAQLDRFRRRAAGEPEPPPNVPADILTQIEAQIESQLAQAPPEMQAQLRQFQQDLAKLSPDELQAWLQQQARNQVFAQADQVLQAATAAQRDNRVAELLPKLEQAADTWGAGEATGSPFANLAQFTRAVIALLAGQPPEPVPPDYVERLANLQRQLQ
jgi:tetratricopeptide (TPR) repeat protein